MALLDIATVPLPLDSTFSINITDHKLVQDGNYVLYTVNVVIEPYNWTVQRRYSDFAQLDKLRFEDRKKSFLPKKKTIGNLDDNFIAERKIELEKYLKSVIELEIWYQRQKGIHSLPLLIAQFLDMHQYEIHCIVDDLSLRLGKVGECWIDGSRKSPKYFEFTPIEMHSIGERMRLAEPALQGRADVCNLIEFMNSLHSLRIRGGKGFVGTSSILSNQLSIDVSYCKNLLALWLIDCDASLLIGHFPLRFHLRKLVVHYSMQSCKEVLGDKEEGEWIALEELDFSFNRVYELDESLSRLPNVHSFIMTHNQLNDIGRYLVDLHSLTHIDLSNNQIKELKNWNEKLGNVKVLILAGNMISSLDGLSKLYSIEYVDVSNNHLRSPEDVTPIGLLPCLNHLILEGNEFAERVDYRTIVFESFGSRHDEVILDGKGVDGKEKSTIGVRLALKRAKIEKVRREEELRRRQERGHGPMGQYGWRNIPAPLVLDRTVDGVARRLTPTVGRKRSLAGAGVFCVFESSKLENPSLSERYEPRF
ncbi:hypothetical protein PRIPAC_81667 [Pristionchus pacificus]|uniref:PX domain-containing protein n=1 Tax=Pristionchus pacificus TaxID=54126 RepID=A0A2A6BYR0_PRIPA|nr:hypothetical protein PRIPAC_81667 [Pristionchus pacificus]|eukprot:PDM71018.1 hypothetical protein PRIPAC_44414 [Pristionchus pacificus]